MARRIRPSPAPWHVERCLASHGRALCVVANGEVLARAPEVGRYGLGTQRQDRVNLALMAAAPELRAALSDLHGALELIGFGDPDADIVGGDAVDLINMHWEQLCAALAKAGVLRSSGTC